MAPIRLLPLVAICVILPNLSRSSPVADDMRELLMRMLNSQVQNEAKIRQHDVDRQVGAMLETALDKRRDLMTSRLVTRKAKEGEMCEQRDGDTADSAITS